jgi:hypothetical protein
MKLQKHTEKRQKKEKQEKALQSSFHTTFVWLLINLVVSLLLYFLYPAYKQLFVCEIFISAVAAFVYHLMLQRFPVMSSAVWKDWIHLRYLDWTLTTPVMLLSLSHFITGSKGVPREWSQWVALDWLMLLSGFAGEKGWLPRNVALLVGFVALFALFFHMAKTLFAVKRGPLPWLLFSFYVLLWTLYGLLYNVDPLRKNLWTNTLDLLAKAMVGLLFASSVVFGKL